MEAHEPDSGVQRTSRELALALRPGSDVSRPARLEAGAIGAMALGAFAIGAAAIGAIAVGRLAIGRLAIGRTRMQRVEIDELVVRRLRVVDGLETPRAR